MLPSADARLGQPFRYHWSPSPDSTGEHDGHEGHVRLVVVMTVIHSVWTILWTTGGERRQNGW